MLRTVSTWLRPAVGKLASWIFSTTPAGAAPMYTVEGHWAWTSCPGLGITIPIRRDSMSAEIALAGQWRGQAIFRSRRADLNPAGFADVNMPRPITAAPGQKSAD